MGTIVKKRFGPRNLVQYLNLKHVCTVGPKPRKEQQVCIENPQDYIIPQSGVNEVLKNMQQGENVSKKVQANTLQTIMVVQGILDLTFGLQNPCPL